MTPSSATATSDPPPSAAAPAASAPQPQSQHVRFIDVLSALNPLQYLPVVGTIYRAVTGDTIPEGLRLAGSFLVSGLISGPIGILTTAAITIAEKITGIDPDRIGRTLLADVGLGKPAQASAPASTAPATLPATPAPTQVTPAAAAPAPPAPTPAPVAAGWTDADLSRQGVTFGTDNTPSWHGLGGADALNEVELGRIQTAAAAYARTAALAS
jgi:hypothetical protein